MIHEIERTRAYAALLALGLLLWAPAFGGPAPGITLQPQMMPREVMYRILFNEIAAYQTAADRLAAQARPSAFLRSHHQNALQLNPTQAAQLIQIALPCAQQIHAIDLQASAIIDAIKSQHKSAARGTPNATVPPPPPDLAELESKRTAVVLAAADSLAADFGPAQFAYFESIVRQYVGSHFKASVAGPTNSGQPQ